MGREVAFSRAEDLRHLPLVCAVTGEREGIERVPIYSKWSVQKGPVSGVESAIKNVRDQSMRVAIPLSEPGRRKLATLTRWEILAGVVSGLIAFSECALIPRMPIGAREDDGGLGYLMLAVFVVAPIPWIVAHVIRRRWTPRVGRRGLYGFALYVPDASAGEAYHRALWDD